MRFISRNGRAISEKKWRALRQDNSYRIVAEDRVGDIFVSTVWWGLDSGLGVFDTWICGGKHHDTHYPYPTQGKAKAGHKRAVALVNDGVESVQSVVSFSPDRQSQMGAKPAL